MTETPFGSILDVPGIGVGHHQRIGTGWQTGTTVLIAQNGATPGVDVRGGGPGTRETDALRPENLIRTIHAITLTGGSAYGLAAADGVVELLEAAGLGFPIGDGVVPVVPAAVIFDLARGGIFANRPDASFGARAARGALSGRRTPSWGSVGAGTGACAGGLQGGHPLPEEVERHLAEMTADEVVDELTKAGMLERIGGIGYITKLLDDVPTASNVGHYASIVRGFSIRRALDGVAQRIRSDALDLKQEVAMVLDQAEQGVYEIGLEQSGTRVQRLAPLLGSALDDFEAARTSGSTGLALGYLDLDRLLTGVTPGNLVLLAARPSVGKSALALSIAHRVAESQGPVAFFSLEMSKHELVQRQREQYGDEYDDHLLVGHKHACYDISCALYERRETQARRAEYGQVAGLEDDADHKAGDCSRSTRRAA